MAKQGDATKDYIYPMILYDIGIIRASTMTL